MHNLALAVWAVFMVALLGLLGWALWGLVRGSQYDRSTFKLAALIAAVSVAGAALTTWYIATGA